MPEPAKNEKIIGQEAYDLLAKELATLIGGKSAKGHTHTADDVTETANKKYVSLTEKDNWNKKVDKDQLDAAIKTFSSGLAWKGVYDTLDALNTAIPTPKEGDFVIVIKEPTFGNGKNTLLIYEGEPTKKWQTVGELFMPGKATTQADGLMSKEDKIKLDGLHNYTLEVATETRLGGVKAKKGNAVTIAGDGVIGIDDTRTVQSGEREKWDKAGTDATNALTQLGTLTPKVTQAEKDITALKEKTQVMTTQEAQVIINKYKSVATA